MQNQNSSKKLKSQEDHLGSLLVEVALNLMGSNLSSFSDAMMQAIEQFGSYLNLDVILVATYDIKSKSIQIDYRWCNLAVHEEKCNFIFDQNAIHDLISKHNDDIPIMIGDIEQSPLDNYLKQNLILQNVKSFYAIPFKSTYDHHMVVFLDFKSSQSFTYIENQFIKQFVQLIEKSLIRQQNDQKNDDHKLSELESTKAKTEFLSNMSHEIRTPLTGIYNAFYLMQSTQLSDGQKSFLDSGILSLDQLSSLVDDILDLSNLEDDQIELDLKAFNLEELLVKMIHSFKHAVDQKGLDIHLIYDYQIQFDIVTDERKLKQILNQFINNAIKYTNQGSITIKVECVKTDPYHIKFSVIDTGIGMDEDILKRIGTPFYQENQSFGKEHQGAGIGLSIAKSLIYHLGGSLSVKSQKNKGSIFEFELETTVLDAYHFPYTNNQSAWINTNNKTSKLQPLFKSLGVKFYDHLTPNQTIDYLMVEDHVEDYNEISNQLKMYENKKPLIISSLPKVYENSKIIDLFLELPLSRHQLYQMIMDKSNHNKHQTKETYQNILNGTALIVDDNRLNRLALESILNKQGISSKSVESGIQAIEAVKQNVFDIVLMDIQMPVMDGIEATRRIRSLGKKYQEIPIIAVTANAFLNDYDTMKSAQISDVVFKPIQVDALIQILRKYIKKGKNVLVPDELMVFDQNDFKNRFLGSEDIAIEVVDDFLSTYSKDLQLIKDAIVVKNHILIIEKAHYFKGSCAYMSGKRVAWVLQLIIDDARKEKLALMEIYYQMLSNEMKDLVIEVKVYHQKHFTK